MAGGRRYKPRGRTWEVVAIMAVFAVIGVVVVGAIVRVADIAST